MRTEERSYAERLVRVQQAGWKRWLDVQRPYRAHLRSLRLGRTLDLGCGIGRNLATLGADGVGIDHNADAVETARGLGLVAYTSDEFRRSPHAIASWFDAILVAHVLEHMHRESARALLGEYLEFLRPGGTVVIITPQERGFRSDPTHVEFMDFPAVGRIVTALDLVSVKQYSFPFPRPLGHVFKYNEFVTIARKPAGTGDGT